MSSERKNSSLVLWAGELKPAKSVLGVLNGSEDYVVSNKFFATKSHFDPKYDAIGVYAGTPDTSKGYRLKSPSIWWKDPSTGSFTRWYVIAWNDRKNTPKQYFIIKPPTVEAINKPAVKLLTIPNGKETPVSEAEANMLAIDYQLSVIMQVLLFSTAFGVDIGTYGAKEMSNEAFFTRFASDIESACKEQGIADKEPLVFDGKMVESFTSPPLYAAIDKIYWPVVENGEEEEPTRAFKTIWESIKDSYSGALGKKGFKTKCPATLKKIMDSSNFCPSPSMRTAVIHKDDKYVKRVQMKVTFRVLNGTGSNAKFCTKILKVSKNEKKPKKVPLTRKLMPEVYGAKEANPVPDNIKGVGRNGFIYLKPSIDFAYYSQGQPTTHWDVDYMRAARVATRIDDYDNNDEYADQSEEDSDSEKRGTGTGLSEDDEGDGYQAPGDDDAI